MQNREPSDTPPEQGGTAVQTAALVVDEDTDRLHKMGYYKRLSRRMTPFDNFALSFTIISILTGCFTLYGFGMTTGGPAVIIFGWIGVGALTVFVGLSMAELTSAFPTSGALYFFSSKLARKHKAAASWYTGWLNVIGQIGGTAGIDFGIAIFLQALISLQWSSFQATRHTTIAIYAGVLVFHGILNSFAVKTVAILNRISVYWHVILVLVLVGVLAYVPAHHQSVHYVLTHVVNTTGFSHTWYVVAIGLLLPGYTFCGFDASAHVSEETGQAATAAPHGIVRSIVVSWIAGLVLLAGITFAIQNYNTEAAASVPPLQIMIDALGLTAAKLLFAGAIVAQLYCGMSSVTANSRLIFALSRDRVLPGSRVWFKVNKSKTPVAAVWLAAGGALVLGLPYLWNPAAFTAITSVNVIGLFSAYGIPIFLRLRARDGEFEQGPWKLKRPKLVAAIAVVWIAIEMVLFVLPQLSPITLENFNYAGVAVLVVVIGASVWWIKARHEYRGPISFGTPEQLVALDEVV